MDLVACGDVCLSLFFSSDTKEEQAVTSEEKDRRPLGSLGASLDDSNQSADSIWQYREGGPPAAKAPDSPGSQPAHRAPPPVKPKPKPLRPTPPNKNNAGSDLMASIQAGQVARSHRPPLGSSSSVDNIIEDDKKTHRLSVEDDTFL